MSCADYNLDDGYLLSDELQNILKDKRFLIKFVVYENDTEDCGKIVVPTTLDLTNLSVDIYSEVDPTIAIISDTPTKEDVLNQNLEKEGVALSYMVDTSNVLFVVDKKYAAIFGYDLPNGERDFKIFYFTVVPFKFKNFSC